MQVKVKDIVNYVSQIAPPMYQESYDNTGLLVGNELVEATGILTTLDVTEEVIREAQYRNCNVVLAHHPIWFSPMKKLTGKNHVERTILMAVRNNINIIVAHTNFDNVIWGVNDYLSKQLSLCATTTLRPKCGKISQLTVYIPPEGTSRLLDTLHEIGVGEIGKYTSCSFSSRGKGTFIPQKNSKPYQGSISQKNIVDEDRVEVRFPTHLTNQVISCLKKNHPYEEPVYQINNIELPHSSIGAGMVGMLPKSQPIDSFLSLLKRLFNLPFLKHSKLCKGNIQRVAVCGGAGSFLIEDALEKNADIFLTSDIKYHDYFKAEHRIILVDLGHYETEIGVKAQFCKIMSEKFTNIVVLKSNNNTNPVYYS